MNDLEIKLGVITTNLTSGLKNAGEQVKSFASGAVKDINRVSSASGDLDRRVGSMLSAFVGAQILRGLYEMVVGADKVNEAISVAAQTAQNLGKALDPAKVTKWVEAFSLSGRGGGFALDQMAQGFQTFASAGANAAQAERLMGLAADIAAGRHMDLSEAVSLVQKVVTGHVALLGRYGFAVKDAAGNTLTAAAAVKVLEEAFKGDAEKRAQSLAGQIGILKNNFEILKNELSVLLAPALTVIVGKLSDLINWFRALSPTAQRLILDTLGLVGAFTGIAMIVPIVVRAIETAGAVLEFFAATPIGLVILALIGLGLWIKYVVDHYQQFYEEQQRIIDWMGKAWQTLIAFLTARYAELGRAIVGLLELYAGKTKQGVADIAAAMKSNLGAWEGVGKAAGNAIASGFNEGIDKVKAAYAATIAYWKALTAGQKVAPFDFTGVPTVDIAGMNLAEAGAGKKGKVEASKIIFTDLSAAAQKAAQKLYELAGAHNLAMWKATHDKFGNLIQDESTARHPMMAGLDVSITPGMVAFYEAQRRATEALKHFHESMVKFIEKLGVPGLAADPKTGALAFNWIDFLLKAVENTKAYADIQLNITQIMRVFGEILDSLRPVIDLVLRGLVLFVNVIIDAYNMIARLVNLLGFHVKLLDQINMLYADVATPLIRIIHDIPTLNELATNKIAPLHPSSFYQGGTDPAQSGTVANTFLSKIVGLLTLLVGIEVLSKSNIGAWFTNLAHNIGSFFKISDANADKLLGGTGQVALGIGLLSMHTTGVLGWLEKIFGVMQIVQGILAIIQALTAVKLIPWVCPEVDQQIETLNRGFIRAGDLKVGDLLRDPCDDNPNEVYAVEILPTVVYRFTTDVETIGVNREHRVMDMNDRWVEVRSLKPGDKIKRYPSGELTIQVVECAGEGRYAAINCRRHRYVLGTSVGHNDSADIGAFIIHTVHKAVAGARGFSTFNAMGNGMLGGFAVAGSSGAGGSYVGDRSDSSSTAIVFNNYGPINGYNDVQKLSKDLAELTARAMRTEKYRLDRSPAS